MWKVFAKPPTPEETVRKLRSDLRKEERDLNRQISRIEAQEAKTRVSIKELARKNELNLCKTLAKELCKSKRQKDRIITSKAQLNSLSMELQRSLALKKVSGSLQKSVHVMKVMNNLVRVPEIEMAMQEMSKEMLKAGLIDEMVNDTLEMYEDVEIDEEAEEEVEKVLLEITKGVLGGIKEAKPSKEREIQKEQEEVSEEEENIDLDEMRNRLSALKG